jgi:deazaflavin-dependent oxidoreductase (nitroreductase family)
MGAYGNYLRWLYSGGRPNAFARAQNRLSALAFGAGLLPRRTAALEIRGRKTGKKVSLPVVVADYDGERYIVSMLGSHANWVRNLEAASGAAELHHGRREPVSLVAVPPEDRAPILRRYLALAPGARPHIPVDRHAPLEEFEEAAADYPVYRIVPRVLPD